MTDNIFVILICRLKKFQIETNVHVVSSLDRLFVASVFRKKYLKAKKDVSVTLNLAILAVTRRRKRFPAIDICATAIFRPID